MENCKTIDVETTKRGLPALWERGGGMTSGGHATVIAKADGTPPRPLFVRTRGQLSCRDHALICLHEGYYIIHAGVGRGERQAATIYKVLGTDVKDIDGEKWRGSAEVELVTEFTHGEWTRVLDEKLEAAVDAAFRKASAYHCRSPYFIDTSPKKEVSPDERKRRQEQMKKQDEEREKKRKAKADREAQEKADKEAASKAAKESGLGDRLEAVNKRRKALGQDPIELGEAYFRSSYTDLLYTEESVRQVEASVERMEVEAEAKRKAEALRQAFMPKMEVFTERFDAVGVELKFGLDDVVASKEGREVKRFPYSDEGVVELSEYLAELESEQIQQQREAEAALALAKAKEEAALLGLPQSIEAWCRSGRTNAGDGWVIGADGVDRDPTSMWNSNPRRLQRYGEGYKIWDQILVGEVVLLWEKASSAADHEFKVVYLPKEGLTEAQKERISEIQDQLEEEWEGACGLSSGIPSPPVGEGWGLL